MDEVAMRRLYHTSLGGNCVKTPLSPTQPRTQPIPLQRPRHRSGPPHPHKSPLIPKIQQPGRSWPKPGKTGTPAADASDRTLKLLRSYRHHETFRLSKLFLIGIKSEELRSPNVQCRRNVENIKAAVTSFCGVLKSQSFRHPMHISPINVRSLKHAGSDVSLQSHECNSGDCGRVALSLVFAVTKNLKLH